MPFAQPADWMSAIQLETRAAGLIVISAGAPALHTVVGPVRTAPTMWPLFKEFLLFLRQEKKWWLVPLIILLLLLGAIIIFSSGSVLAPLMYPFM